MNRNPDRGAPSYYALDCTLENLELKLGDQGIADEVKEIIWKYDPLQLIRAILFIHASDEHLKSEDVRWRSQGTELDDMDAFSIFDRAWELSSEKTLKLGDCFGLPPMSDEQKEAFSWDAYGPNERDEELQEMWRKARQ